MRKTFIIAVCASYLAISSLATGTSTPAKTDSLVQDTLQSSQATDRTVFRGIVQKLDEGDEGTALFTDKKVYPLLGGDFKTIVGKEVNIIGKVVLEEDIEKIIVARIQLDKR
ncbi:MAG: hypothetical protein WBB19_16275 [Desulforhopalus sp.]